MGSCHWGACYDPVVRTALVLLSLLAAGCPQPDPGKPGSPSNPVDVCGEVGQVCKTGDAPLGVCTKSTTAVCDKPDGCFVCMSQH